MSNLFLQLFNGPNELFRSSLFFVFPRIKKIGTINILNILYLVYNF